MRTQFPSIIRPLPPARRWYRGIRCRHHLDLYAV